MKSKSRVDFNRYISLHINSFKYFGVWFYNLHSKTSIKFWVYLLIQVAIGVFVFFLPTAGQILYLVKYTVSGDAEIQKIAGTIHLILAELLTSFKLLDLRMRRCGLARVMRQLDGRSFGCFDARAQMVHYRAIRLARNLFKVLLCSATISVVVHAVIVPALQRFQTLPLKMDLLFFDVNTKPYFNYVCAYQILYKPTMITVCVAIQSLPWAFLLYAISELNILIHTIENVEKQMKVVKLEDNCDDNEAFKFIITKCINHYNTITSFIEEFQSAFSGQFSMSIVTTAGILGTSAVQILSIDSVIHQISEVIWIFMYMVNFTLMSFIDCYFGNIIAERSLQVATVLYSCPWINKSKGLKRDVVMLIARAQRPLTVSAAKLVPMSLETFTKVMNWTYKSFAVLNHMKKN